MNGDSETLIQALRDMPTPPPRPGFVDRALANAIAAAPPREQAAPRRRLKQAATRWETWFGAAFGAAAAAAITLFLLRPAAPVAPQNGGLTFALNEARDVDVLIESERRLEDAVIRIAVNGPLALDGFEDEREINWRTTLERGGNLLSLPIVARGTGAGRLVAVVEHEGRTRTIMVDLTVLDTEPSQS